METTKAVEEMVVRLSPTKAACALSCPRKYGYSYIHFIKPRLTPSVLVFGSAVHKALEFAAANVNAPRPGAAIADAFEAALNVAEGEGIQYKKGEDFDALLHQGRALILLWAEERYPQLCAAKVLGTEIKLESVLDRDLKLLAYPDVATEEDGRVVVTNYKTAAAWGQSKDGEPPSADEVLMAKDIQLTFEAFLWRAVNGKRPDILRKEILKKTKKPEIVVAETTRTDEELDAFGDWLRGVAGLIRFFHNTETAMPAFGKNCGWCAYSPLCFEEEGAEEKFYVREKQPSEIDTKGAE
jgi:hypothetical protein